MTAYTELLQITVNSAIDTAHICYRKARRDCYRIHGLLTHPRTVQAAKIAVWCLYLGAVIAFTLGQTARILVDTGAKAIQQWAEAEVQSCLYIEDYEIDYQADYGIPDDIWNSDPDHVADTDEADPFSSDTNPHYPAVAQPKEPTIRELKRLASEAKIKGYSTMSKATLMEVLQDMECWALSEDCLA